MDTAMRDNLAEIRLGIEAVELRCLDQAVDCRGAPATRIRPCKRPIAPAECKRADRALGG